MEERARKDVEACDEVSLEAMGRSCRIMLSEENTGNERFDASSTEKSERRWKVKIAALWQVI